MADYGKQTAEHGCEDMPNPFKVVVANPTETQKAVLADMFGWLLKVYTPEPTYDPETQYTTHTWEVVDNQLVRTWTVHDKPFPEPSVEEHLDEVDAQATYTAVETGTLIEE